MRQPRTARAGDPIPGGRWAEDVGPPDASVGGQLGGEAPFPSDRLGVQGKPPSETYL